MHQLVLQLRYLLNLLVLLQLQLQQPNRKILVPPSRTLPALPTPTPPAPTPPRKLTHHRVPTPLLLHLLRSQHVEDRTGNVVAVEVHLV
jgi:hypothetical protein